MWVSLGGFISYLAEMSSVIPVWRATSFLVEWEGVSICLPPEEDTHDSVNFMKHSLLHEYSAMGVSVSMEEDNMDSSLVKWCKPPRGWSKLVVTPLCVRMVL